MVALNKEQIKAVHTSKGKILVLAGAGSGKTSVLINRCVHLIKQLNVAPKSILGLTFTNKAAEEMRKRIAKRIGADHSKEIMLSTFHSFCFYVLKQQIHHLGYTRQFSIYDERDVERLTKTLEKQLASKENETVKLELLQKELAVSMKAFNAVDFDGLLSLTVELFKQFPYVLKEYQDRFEYIMIDEYQDTNAIQFELASLLAKNHGNLFVVGDDDQSIYSWRGAEVKHILEFNYHTLVKLEQNYRSTKPILDVANHVIKNNTSRHDKSLWSQTTLGDLAHLFHAPNEHLEAEAVIERIVQLKTNKGLKWSDFAILYRSNNLSRPFELALMKAPWQNDGRFVRGVPYKVIQGMEFFERAEVKDFFAYLKTIVNPSDQQALLRIINYPRRGISIKTIDILTKFNRQTKTSLWDVLKDPSQLELTTQAKKGIALFISLMEEATKRFETTPLKSAMKWLMDELDLKQVIHDEVKSEKARLFKWDNLQAFLDMADNCEGENPTLHDFVNTTLLDQNRHKKASQKNDRVNLLTFHSAKGLEFPACFLVAIEDRFLPHERSLAEDGLEEERRLFYVAITRAKKYLTFSMAQKRTSYGKEVPTNPSRFLFEIPKDLLLIESWDRPTFFHH